MRLKGTRIRMRRRSFIMSKSPSRAVGSGKAGASASGSAGWVVCAAARGRPAARSRRKRTSSESRRRKAAVIAGRDPDEQGGMMIAVPRASLPWNSAMQCRALDPRAILPVRGARRKHCGAMAGG